MEFTLIVNQYCRSNLHLSYKANPNAKKQSAASLLIRAISCRPSDPDGARGCRPITRSHSRIDTIFFKQPPASCCRNMMLAAWWVLLLATQLASCMSLAHACEAALHIASFFLQLMGLAGLLNVEKGTEKRDEREKNQSRSHVLDIFF